MSENKVLKATHEGTININGIEIRCYNLNTGERVLSREGLLRAIGRKGNPKFKEDETDLFQAPVFLRAKNLKPFISNDLLTSSKHILFEISGGRKAYGYLANILPEVCYVFTDAKKEGVLSNSQKNYAARAEILIRGFATLGIIALVDEATGYQDVRVKDALQKILDQYLLEEAKKYKVTFPLDLYKQWFRLNNWEWKPESAQKKPSVIGRWTNKYIYERMAPGLLKELERKNPKNEKGYRPNKHFQFLTDEVGEPKLREFFGGLIALAKASTTWKKYLRLVERAYPRKGDQLEFLIDDVEDYK